MIGIHTGAVEVAAQTNGGMRGELGKLIDRLAMEYIHAFGLIFVISHDRKIGAVLTPDGETNNFALVLGDEVIVKGDIPRADHVMGQFFPQQIQRRKRRVP